MKEQILFIALDVDDKAYHGHGRLAEGNKEFAFRCKSSLGLLVKKLEGFKEQGYRVKICYESTYLGFSLCRSLREAGFECDVIASSLIPRRTGDKVKTDRLDCKKLSEYFKNNQLTVVRVPTEEQETVRDLVRSRFFLKDQVKGVKLHILAMCRRLSWRYREPGTTTSYWTGPHRKWLEGQLKQVKDRALKFNLTQLMDHLKLLEAQVGSYDVEIEQIAHSPLYKSRIEALCCYRGIDTLTAMGFVVEIWDANRFNHPKQLASYAGMDLMEDSSGGKEKKYRMTKMGNSHLRTMSIEASQSVFQPPRVSKRLKKRREGVDGKFIDIADKCMRRLHKKSTRLLYGGKLKNKVKVACARELLCFVWESLRAAA